MGDGAGEQLTLNPIEALHMLFYDSTAPKHYYLEQS
jgi:hypothetical protein